MGVRFLVIMRAIPCLETSLVGSLREQLDFVRIFQWAKYIQPHKTDRVFHEMRPVYKNMLDGRHHIVFVVNGKFADYNKHGFTIPWARLNGCVDNPMPSIV
jgi:hypothetical protein